LRTQDLVHLHNETPRQFKEAPLPGALVKTNPRHDRERIGPEVARGRRRGSEAAGGSESIEYRRRAGRTLHNGAFHGVRYRNCRSLPVCFHEGTGLAALYGPTAEGEPCMADLSETRRQMVAHQIQERGVRSAAVARAMREVPREE